MCYGTSVHHQESGDRSQASAKRRMPKYPIPSRIPILCVLPLSASLRGTFVCVHRPFLPFGPFVSFCSSPAARAPGKDSENAFAGHGAEVNAVQHATHGFTSRPRFRRAGPEHRRARIGSADRGRPTRCTGAHQAAPFSFFPRLLFGQLLRRVSSHVRPTSQITARPLAASAAQADGAMVHTKVHRFLFCRPLALLASWRFPQSEIRNLKSAINRRSVENAPTC